MGVWEATAAVLGFLALRWLGVYDWFGQPFPPLTWKEAVLTAAAGPILAWLGFFDWLDLQWKMMRAAKRRRVERESRDHLTVHTNTTSQPAQLRSPRQQQSTEDVELSSPSRDDPSATPNQRLASTVCGIGVVVAAAFFFTVSESERRAGRGDFASGLTIAVACGIFASILTLIAYTIWLAWARLLNRLRGT